MKKLFSLLLASVMTVGLLAGCGGGSEAPADDAATGDVYNVCNLVNGNLGDKSFFDSAEAGLAKLAEEGKITYKTIEMGATDADQPKWLETLYEVAGTGEYDLIICGTYQMPEYLKEVADEYPDQKFLIYDDTTHVGENANVVNMSFKQNDLGYMVGVFAGSMTTSGHPNTNEDAVLGFLGGVDSPVINDFLYGYLEGAKSVNPDVKVDTRYVTNYYDTAYGKELALSMINDKNADIVWGVGGAAGNGGAEAAQETGKAWFIGVDSDQESTFGAELAAVTLTSGLKNVGDGICWFFDEWAAGNEYWGTEVNLGIAEGGVGVVTDKNFTTVPQEVQDAVLAAQEAIVAGEIVVPSALADGGNDAAIALRDSMQP
ncbi:MAG: BMP family ABC transporter substrate-binding protein [Anaerotignum sp.]|nr:BMP family ABC transporter substrate-binding protein [Anaerotignum sp.]MBQ3614976.1 BMP family ABC transporter substrate-binding protein [Anaerotignum sp.]MBQ7085006.1 BMP family ABC transporter substrate-binding protein [Anaerotignum sp.]